ncbi:hypothetical protein hmeg3_15095 [Herbaspirillum sp. meg3]|nr:hypothetical protein hmeg3_15095 [Herbaspirillum sp. meg3]
MQLYFYCMCLVGWCQVMSGKYDDRGGQEEGIPLLGRSRMGKARHGVLVSQQEIKNAAKNAASLCALLNN